MRKVPSISGYVELDLEFCTFVVKDDPGTILSAN